jgi:hypothetical protein
VNGTEASVSVVKMNEHLEIKIGSNQYKKSLVQRFLRNFGSVNAFIKAFNGELGHWAVPMANWLTGWL